MNACREYLYPIDERWNAVLFMQKVGFIQSDPTASSLSTNVNFISTTSVKFTQTTTSQRPSVTPTTTTTTPTTPTKTTTTTTNPTTPTTTTTITNNNSSTTPTTTTTTTTIKTPKTPLTTTTTTTSPMISSHIELCPDHVRNDLSIFKGFLGQYGDYCFELVDVKIQWHNAQRHCTVAGDGFLVHVTNQLEQDYIVRFLSNHTYVESIWLGLTDSEQEGATAEGKWTWISGDPVTFTKFGPDFNTQTANDHKLHDCVIMKNGGEWTDVPCGVSLFVGTGFGESHPFICQYKELGVSAQGAR
ncbi:REG3B-like protein [Mya arenaria]|uniref:REG3B-like protein n=1 Tax=Mya arenaria TaxID=6604 RepID=A0ABY7F0H9_MYAAR|nr:REG3B-like protein [Mya arenaria]